MDVLRVFHFPLMAAVIELLHDLLGEVIRLKIPPSVIHPVTTIEHGHGLIQAYITERRGSSTVLHQGTYITITV